MDNAQLFPIPLDSPLEPSNEHALVPANNPSFSYNPQNSISGLLHNAIKYEGDGVFCGKYRYDWDVKYTYEIRDVNISANESNIIISQNGDDIRDDIARNYYKDDGVPYAIDVKYPNTNRLRDLSFVWGILEDNNAIKNSIGRNISLTRIGDEYILTGNTNLRSLNIVMRINAYTGELISISLPQRYLHNIEFGNDTILAQIVRQSNSQDHVVLQLPEVIDHNLADRIVDISNINVDGDYTIIDTRDSAVPLMQISPSLVQYYGISGNGNASGGMIGSNDSGIVNQVGVVKSIVNNQPSTPIGIELHCKVEPRGLFYDPNNVPRSKTVEVPTGWTIFGNPTLPYTFYWVWQQAITIPGDPPVVVPAQAVVKWAERNTQQRPSLFQGNNTMYATEEWLNIPIDVGASSELARFLAEIVGGNTYESFSMNAVWAEFYPHNVYGSDTNSTEQKNVYLATKAGIRTLVGQVHVYLIVRSKAPAMKKTSGFLGTGIGSRDVVSEETVETYYSAGFDLYCIDVRKGVWDIVTVPFTNPPVPDLSPEGLAALAVQWGKENQNSKPNGPPHVENPTEGGMQGAQEYYYDGIQLANIGWKLKDEIDLQWFNDYVDNTLLTPPVRGNSEIFEFIGVRMGDSCTAGQILVTVADVKSRLEPGQEASLTFTLLNSYKRSYIESVNFVDTSADNSSLVLGTQTLGVSVTVQAYKDKTTYQDLLFSFFGRDTEECSLTQRMLLTTAVQAVGPIAQGVPQLTANSLASKVDEYDNTIIPDTRFIISPMDSNNLLSIFLPVSELDVDDNKVIFSGTLNSVFDKTSRFIIARPGRILSKGGLLSGVTTGSLRMTMTSGNAMEGNRIDVSFTIASGRVVVLSFLNGQFVQSPNDTSQLELIDSGMYSRQLQWTDGSFTRQFATPTEITLINRLESTTFFGPVDNINEELRNLYLQVLTMLHAGIAVSVVNRTIEQSYQDGVITLAQRNTLNTDVGTPAIPTNTSDYGGVYTLLFIDADKLEVEFWPIGMVERAREDIIYKRHNKIGDGDNIEFSYIDRYGTTQDASITVWPTDTKGEPGRAYSQATAFDIEQGIKTDLKLFDPDEDYCITTEQFDTQLDTINMFYIDSMHIIKDTTSNFILLEKQSDSWKEIISASKVDVLGSNQVNQKYGVSCAEESYPFFYIIEPEGDAILIRHVQIQLGWLDDRFFDVLATSLSFVGSVIKFSSLRNTGFSESTLSFVADVPSSDHFLSIIRVSSTCVNNQFLLGIVYDEGISQWTLTFDGNNIRVFNGYGYVGIDGTVTGGSIPVWAMNTRTGLNVTIIPRPANSLDYSKPRVAVSREGLAITRDRAAYVQGSNLVFLNRYFNGGICTAAIYNGGEYEFITVPLFPSIKSVNRSTGDSGTHVFWQPKHVGGLNFGLINFATNWSYSTSAAGLVYNGWTVDKLSEDDVSGFISTKDKYEANGKISLFIKIAMAVGSMSAAFAANYVEQRAGIKEGKQDIKAKEEFRQKEEQNKELIEAISALKEAIKEGAGGNAEHHLDNLRDEQRELIKELYEDPLLEGIGVALDVLATGNISGVISESLAMARLGSSALYSVSPNSNIYAGPGFTQIHFTQGARISGSFGWTHAARGGGALWTPRLPDVPLPFIGPTDLNVAPTGVSPLEGPNVYHPYRRFQTNTNVGSKHVVYSYPIAEIKKHVIRNTELNVVVREENTELYKSEYGFQNYNRYVLTYPQRTTSNTFLQNCSLVQGVDSLFDASGNLEVPIQIDSGYPFYADPTTYDYCVYAVCELYYTALAGEITGVSIKDTKLLDGPPSNIVIRGELPLIASPYTCISIGRTLNRDTTRPIVFSGDTLVFPTTGLNVIKGLNVLHGFDGYTNRIISLTGEVGADIEEHNLIHTHISQGPVKTGSIYPGLPYIGKFSSAPEIAKYNSRIEIYAKYIGNLDQATENLQGYRFAIPIVHKNLAHLPSVIQTLAPYKTHVIDGVTSLTTELRTTTALSKSSAAQDFTINSNMYRVNDEYISQLLDARNTGVVSMKEVVITLGLRYLGSTPQVAWFYSPVTNTFFTYTMSNPSTSATIMSKNIEAYRFKDAEVGTWDYVSQEVAFRVLLDRDYDETEDGRRHRNKDIVRVTDHFVGNIYPANEHIGDDYEMIGLASGLVLQGKNRGQVNRFVMHDYMFREVKEMEGLPGFPRGLPIANDGLQINHGNWIRVRGNELEDFWSERDYKWDDDRFHHVYGFFFEPFKLATSFLGIGENTDCIFEWDITFALTPMMRRVWKNKYVTINLAAETMTPGGAISGEVSHIYLTQEHFNRNKIKGSSKTSRDSLGYYTYRFNSLNGAGNSEKLYLWSDGCIAIKSMHLAATEITTQRHSPLVTMIEVSELEML